MKAEKSLETNENKEIKEGDEIIFGINNQKGIAVKYIPLRDSDIVKFETDATEG